MKIACNNYGMPLKYEAVHPEENSDARIVQIAFSDSCSYMETVKMLNKKGILNGKNRFILNTSDMTAADIDLVIPALKQEGYIVSLYTDAEQTLSSAICECDALTLRLYGMSRNSYSRTGLYNYDDIMKNIEKIVSQVKNNCCIEYQLFQFNMGEVRMAKGMADELGVDMKTVYAEFHDQKRKRDYLSGNMTTHNIIEESKKFFFTYLEQLEAEAEALIEKFAGKAKLIIDANGNFESEWNPDGQSIIPIDDIDSFDSWLSWNRSMFYHAQSNKAALLLWLWNHNNLLNQNNRFHCF